MIIRNNSYQELARFEIKKDLCEVIKNRSKDETIRIRNAIS